MKKLEATRQLMAKDNVGAYILFNTDAHQNEYLPDRYKYIKWLTNFSGSNATVVITQSEAYLWTDPRYFEQAALELEGSGFKLIKDFEGLGYIKWLSNNLKKRSTLGFNGNLCNAGVIVEILKQCSDLKINVNHEYDLIEKLWADRPISIKEPVTVLDKHTTGKSIAEKLEEIRASMKKLTCGYNLISKLDDIAWIYNMRGNDILYNPVVKSYTLISLTDAVLFIDIDKLPKNYITILNNNDIIIKDYDSVHAHLMYMFGSERKSSFLFAKSQNCYSIYKFIVENFKTVDVINPSTILKSIKNDVEIKNIRQAMIKDGIVLTRFFMWLEDTVNHTQITEYEAASKLTEFYEQDPDFICHSFATISAYKSNSALPHYFPDKEKSSTIKPDGLYLLDAGAHFKNGTTDITRVVSLGNLTDEEKNDFTLVLKAMINGISLKFPENTKGYQIDAITRESLWGHCIDFGHGTGHGVGYLLNVHEGPFVLNQNPINISLKPGNITSVEPGIYKSGKYGIRIENLGLVKKTETNSFGLFYDFEILTNFIIQTDLINEKLLEQRHLNWLNNYNEKVIANLAKYLTNSEIAWLKEKSNAI